MSLLEGSTGDVVADLQSVLTYGAPGQWGTTPTLESAVGLTWVIG